MTLVYFSKTNNITSFINKLDIPLDIIDGNTITTINEEFILLTYTSGFGETPPEVLDFLVNNSKHLKYVCCSGNKNWGINYAKAADNINSIYGTPILMKFELSGNSHDIKKFEEKVRGVYDKQ